MKVEIRDTAEDWLKLLHRVERGRALATLNGNLPPPGTPIGIQKGAKKYGCGASTVWRWVDRKMIRVIKERTGQGPGSATLIDEYELARLATIYRDNAGRGKRTAIWVGPVRG